MAKTRVLLVDDELALLNGLRRRLGFDFEIITASSGIEGLQSLRSQDPFSVIVTDMMMPQMTGIEFIIEARQIAPQSVYIMLTGNQDEGTSNRARIEGHVFRFLNKPCDSAELRSAIEAAAKHFRFISSKQSPSTAFSDTVVEA